MVVIIENIPSNKQKARSNGGRGGTKKTSGGGSAGAGGGVGGNKKNGGVTKAVQKKIDAWWEKNYSALARQASVEESGLKEGSAKDAVKAYKQFLQVKREMQDWENKLLPCDLVVEMMDNHEECKDFDYQSDMKFICGHDFEGKNLVKFGENDDIDRARAKATFEAVQKRFGSEFNEKLWNTVLVDIADFTSKTMQFRFILQKSDPLESAFGAYTLARDPVEPLSNFQFLLYRTKEVIDPNVTAVELGLSYSDTIAALHTDETMIEIRKQGSSATVIFWAADKTETMTTELSKLVNDGEEDESDYVFMFKDKLIYGFDTPMALQMKHFDTIEAIPLQDYKYKRCICCNNADGHVVEG